MRKAFVFMVLAALILAVPARAQDKRVDVNIGGGYTFALSDVKDQLGNGYNFNLGVTIWATPKIGIQAGVQLQRPGREADHDTHRADAARPTLSAHGLRRHRDGARSSPT